MHRHQHRESTCEDRDTENSHVKMEAEMGVVLTQVKEHLGLPDAGRGKDRSFASGLGGSMALKTP